MFVAKALAAASRDRTWSHASSGQSPIDAHKRGAPGRRVGMGVGHSQHSAGNRMRTASRDSVCRVASLQKSSSRHRLSTVSSDNDGFDADETVMIEKLYCVFCESGDAK